MTVKTTLSFTDRHHRFLTERVGEGMFASQSAVVAAALEQMIRDEEERDLTLAAMADVIRDRMRTPLEDYVDAEDAFAAARAVIAAARGA
ncbi:hypothetical protein [Paracoccus sp. (in: a-proteobacteria)]|uniref:hypothetical protein n=1 Tax=Paracoccus sp. TaxID=267 RepID=UPI0032208E86